MIITIKLLTHPSHYMVNILCVCVIYSPQISSLWHSINNYSYHVVHCCFYSWRTSWNIFFEPLVDVAILFYGIECNWQIWIFYLKKMCSFCWAVLMILCLSFKVQLHGEPVSLGCLSWVFPGPQCTFPYS